MYEFTVINDEQGVEFEFFIEAKSAYSAGMKVATLMAMTTGLRLKSNKPKVVTCDE